MSDLFNGNDFSGGTFGDFGGNDFGDFGSDNAGAAPIKSLDLSEEERIKREKQKEANKALEASKMALRQAMAADPSLKERLNAWSDSVKVVGIYTYSDKGGLERQDRRKIVSQESLDSLTDANARALLQRYNNGIALKKELVPFGGEAYAADGDTELQQKDIVAVFGSNTLNFVNTKPTEIPGVVGYGIVNLDPSKAMTAKKRVYVAAGETVNGEFERNLDDGTAVYVVDVPVSTDPNKPTILEKDMLVMFAVSEEVSFTFENGIVKKTSNKTGPLLERFTFSFAASKGGKENIVSTNVGDYRNISVKMADGSEKAKKEWFVKPEFWADFAAVQFDGEDKPKAVKKKKEEDISNATAIAAQVRNLLGRKQ